MRAGRGLVAEATRALEDDVDTQIAPRQLGRVFLGVALQLFTIHVDIAVADLNFAGELAVG